MPKAPSPDELGFARKPDSLSVGEPLGFATELFEENAILFLSARAKTSTVLSGRHLTLCGRALMGHSRWVMEANG